MLIGLIQVILMFLHFNRVKSSALPIPLAYPPHCACVCVHNICTWSVPSRPTILSDQLHSVLHTGAINTNPDCVSSLGKTSLGSTTFIMKFNDESLESYLLLQPQSLLHSALPRCSNHTPVSGFPNTALPHPCTSTRAVLLLTHSSNTRGKRDHVRSPWRLTL